MKPIFKLCYGYLMQLVLLDSLRERLGSWGTSVSGEESAPAWSAWRPVRLQSARWCLARW